MLHEELTGKVLQACFEVIGELGAGFIESVYENSLIVALHQKGLKAKGQVPLEVKFRGKTVGEFKVDLLVEEKVLIELKTARCLAKEHYAQVINYLKATCIEVGLFINFGNPKIEYKRFNNQFLGTTNLRNILKE